MSTEGQKFDSEHPELKAMLGEDYEQVQLLNASQVSDLLAVSERSVYDLRIPQVRLSRRRVRWSLEDVLAFRDDRRQAA